MTDPTDDGPVRLTQSPWAYGAPGLPGPESGSRPTSSVHDYDSVHRRNAVVRAVVASGKSAA